MPRKQSKPGNVSKKKATRTVLYTTYSDMKSKLTAENKTLKIKLESTQADKTEAIKKVNQLLKQKSNLERKNLTIEEEKSVAYDNLLDELRNMLPAEVDARTETQIMNAVRQLKQRALTKEDTIDIDSIVKPKDLRKCKVLRGSPVITDWRGITQRYVVGDICELRARDLPDQPAEMFEDLGPAD